VSILCTIRETSVSTLGNIQRTLSEHSVNNQGNFSEHAGNIQRTSSEHSVNNQGKFSEHAGNIQGTLSEHSGNIELP
jgi:hypothetical protein